MALVIDHWTIGAAVLVALSISLSFYEIISHLLNFNKPYLQRYIIRILLMVPIYSLNAWIAMLVPTTGVYLDSMREVYESFVIYSFMKYLLNYLQFETNLQQYIHNKPGPGHIFPICCLPNCVGGRDFLIRCKNGILQYVVVRPITSMIAFISYLFDFYGEGNYNPLSGYTYPVLLLINNASQITAMYCLVIFYTGYRQELTPMRPLAKFFSIKLVVFFSFFQYVVISGLLEIEAVEKMLKELFPDLDDKISIGRKLQELLICFDMLIAAIGHVFAFSYTPFKAIDDDGTLLDAGSHSYISDLEDRSCCSALLNLFDFTEEKSDIREHFNELFLKIRQIFRIKSAPLPVVVTEDRDNTLTNDFMAVVGQSDNDHQSASVSSSKAPINSSIRNYQSIEP